MSVCWDICQDYSVSNTEGDIFKTYWRSRVTGIDTVHLYNKTEGNKELPWNKRKWNYVNTISQWLWSCSSFVLPSDSSLQQYQFSFLCRHPLTAASQRNNKNNNKNNNKRRKCLTSVQAPGPLIQLLHKICSNSALTRGEQEITSTVSLMELVE